MFLADSDYISHGETKDGSLAVKVKNKIKIRQAEYPYQMLYFGRCGGWLGEADVTRAGLVVNHKWSD